MLVRLAHPIVLTPTPTPGLAWPGLAWFRSSERFLPTVTMPPSFDFSDWLGAKDAHRGTPVVVKMDNPNWSMLELQSPTKAAGLFEADKMRDKNAKQLTWVLMLKAHRAAGCLAWLAMGTWTVLAAVKKRLIFQEGVAPSSTLDKPSKSRLFHCIRTFLLFSVIMLGVEIVAYFKGWHFNARPFLHVPTVVEVQSFPHVLYLSWVFLRKFYIAPPLQFLADTCIILFLIQSADRLLLCLGCMWIKYKGIKPVAKVDTFKTDDLENPDAAFPRVLVQIPMCNEREVGMTCPRACLPTRQPAACFIYLCVRFHCFCTSVIAYSSIPTYLRAGCPAGVSAIPGSRLPDGMAQVPTSRSGAR